MVDGAKIFISVFFILFSVGSALETGDQDVVTMNRKHDGAPCELCKKSVTIFSSEVKKICRLPIWKKTLICNTSSNKTETFVQTLSIKDARSVCSKIGLCRAHSSGNGIGIETVCKLCKGLKSYFERSIRRDEAAGKTMKMRFKKFINQAFRAFNPCQDKVMEKYCPRDTKEPDDDTCGIVKIKPKLGIIGGFEAYKGQFPWQAQIQKLKQGYWRHTCGGTLIKDEWILSAAHCFGSGNEGDFKFVLGQYDRSRKDGTEQEFSASRIITHENFKHNGSIPLIKNDIALIKLNGKVKINDYVRTACMPKKGEQFTSLKCTASGWGRYNLGDRSLSNILNAVQMHIMNLQDCRQQFGRVGVKMIFDTNVCAGYKQEVKSPCQGDSGGPLACKKYNEPWKVTGIVSWGSSFCNEPAAVFTGVASYIDWINRTISKY